MRQIPDIFLGKNVHDTALDVQAEINRVAGSCSPKTVRNHHGFISAVLNVFYPSLKLNISLPQKVKADPYIPSDEDIKKILGYVKGTEYEIPVILACYGLHRSEICALTLEDIDGDVGNVNKGKILGDSREWGEYPFFLTVFMPNHMTKSLIFQASMKVNFHILICAVSQAQPVICMLKKV